MCDVVAVRVQQSYVKRIQRGYHLSYTVFGGSHLMVTGHTTRVQPPLSNSGGMCRRGAVVGGGIKINKGVQEPQVGMARAYSEKKHESYQTR